MMLFFALYNLIEPREDESTIQLANPSTTLPAMKPLSVVFTLSLAALNALAGTPSIIYPSSGSTINPGAPFDFKYSSIADYARFINFADYASGYYFGRFSLPNYPGNPYPSNPPPQQLVMPNFAKLPKGFGCGINASNQTVYIAVIEEYATGQGSLGYKMSLSYNAIRYNVTGDGAPFDVHLNSYTLSFLPFL
ncbi:hypothetical protein BDQ17DRAFT_610937 [Cyathus striatus]|nr:hypothetical protein BDQ17DRAFT_610937 [Cyathus striatus]